MTRSEPTQTRHGFTIVELMIVVTIMAMIFAIAVPALMSARVSTNENAAIATLRSIASAQSTVMSQAAIDSDADGSGEAAYFGELSGRIPVRVYSAGGPQIGGPTEVLDPDLLAVRFASIISDGTHGVVERQGYYFKMFLPNNASSAPIGGVGESQTGGTDPANFPGSSNAEIMWCCYAWPVRRGKTGSRAFFINADGDVKSTQNPQTQPGGSYDGFTRVPAADAIYAIAGDISSQLGTANSNQTPQDQLIWTPVGN